MVRNSPAGFVLAVGASNGDNGSDGKVVVEFDVRVFGRVFEAIEKSRGSRGFATAGMARKRHACQVYFAVERTGKKQWGGGASLLRRADYSRAR